MKILRPRQLKNRLLPGWVPIPNAAMARISMANMILPVIARVLSVIIVDTEGVPDSKTLKRTYTRLNNAEIARRTCASLRSIQRSIRRLAKTSFIIIEYESTSDGPRRIIRLGPMWYEDSAQNAELLKDAKAGQGRLQFETPSRVARQPVQSGTLFDVPRRQITALAVGSDLRANNSDDRSKLSPPDKVVTPRPVTPCQGCHPMHSEKTPLKKTTNKENNGRSSVQCGVGARLEGAATATESQKRNYPKPPDSLDDIRLQQWLMMSTEDLNQLSVMLGDAYGRALNLRDHDTANKRDAERKWVLTLIHMRTTKAKP